MLSKYQDPAIHFQEIEVMLAKDLFLFYSLVPENSFPAIRRQVRATCRNNMNVALIGDWLLRGNTLWFHSHGMVDIWTPDSVQDYILYMACKNNWVRINEFPKTKLDSGRCKDQWCGSECLKKYFALVFQRWWMNELATGACLAQFDEDCWGESTQ